MMDTSVKFLHLRSKEWIVCRDGLPREQYKRTGGITVMYKVSPRHIDYAFAQCSKKDAYSKKLGREVCELRMAYEDQFTGRIVRSLGRVSPRQQVLADLANVWGIV